MTHHRQLLLLRHGKSSWDTFDSDFERPLTDKGQQSVKRVAIYMLQNNLVPDFILSSPAQRAIHTSSIICDSLGLKSDAIHTDSQIYNARYEELLTVIAQCPQQSRRVLLVGHNPSLEELVEFLCVKPTGSGNNLIHLSPSTLVQLETNNDWGELHSSCVNLLSLTHSKNLVGDNS